MCGGPITGRRADLLLIDDPVKSQAEADSGTARDHLWDWFRADLVTRLKPGGRVVLVMTRWHPDDLGGRLLLQSSDAWRVVRLPALAEEDDLLGRPCRSAALAGVGRRGGIVGGSVQCWETGRSRLCFSNRRGPLVGASSRRRNCRLWRKRLRVCRCGLGDLAATQDGDFTAGVLLTRTETGSFQVKRRQALPRWP